MGQTLSEPVTEKHSSSCANERFKVGASCMQGWRISMDDAHTHILALPDDPHAAYFGVYDGHGGAHVAEFASRNLHKFVTARPEYRKGDVVSALKMGFLDADASMMTEEITQDRVVGSTAVVVLIRGDMLYCANLGDSRAVACLGGSVSSLSHDHKPNNKKERERIEKGGGWVQLNRVNGNLALSRALGDYIYKKNAHMPCEEQIVTAFPDVQMRTLGNHWEFIVMACDGIWEVLSNEEVITFCRNRLMMGEEPWEVCEALMHRCLAPNAASGGLGCDNMTVMIIQFKNALFPKESNQSESVIDEPTVSGEEDTENPEIEEEFDLK